MMNLQRLKMMMEGEKAATELNIKARNEAAMIVGFLPNMSATTPEVKVPTT